MVELTRESRIGAVRSTAVAGEVPRIDLADFAARREEIADALWDAAVAVGFFQVVNHGIEPARVREAFAMTERFFGLPDPVKVQYPHKRQLFASSTCPLAIQHVLLFTHPALGRGYLIGFRGNIGCFSV
jgi:isopenicillin N synthase-like dioxygenase